MEAGAKLPGPLQAGEAIADAWLHKGPLTGELWRVAFFGHSLLLLAGVQVQRCILLGC